MDKHYRNIILLSTCIFISHSIFADNVTAALKTTATLTAFCSIGSTDMNFGELAKSSASWAASSTGTISVTCSNNLPYKVSVGLGINSVSDQSYLVGSAGDKVRYALCKYNTTSGTLATPVCGPSNTGWLNLVTNPTYGYFTVLGNGQQQTLSIYGFALPGYYTPDIYSDTVTTTISY